MTSITKLIALGALAAASAPFALATPIVAGGTAVVSTPVTVTIASPTNIVAQTNGILTGTDNTGAVHFTGTYSEYVVQDSTNIYGANDLTFVIAVTNTTSAPLSPDIIENVNNGSFLASMFGGFTQVNVGSDAQIAGLPTLGAADSDIPSSINETIAGTVQFNFLNDPINPGTGTEYLVIQTANTNYVAGQLNALDNGTASVAGFMPTAATPEPSSLALLGTGLIGGAASLMRRRRSMLL